MKRIVAGGAGVLVVGLLGGCDLMADQEFRDERTVADRVAAITIAGGAGSVTVSASPDGTIHVKRHVRYRDDRPGATDSVRGDTLILNTSCGRVCLVDYEVTAPRGVRVNGRNGSGDITLSGIASATLEVGSGNVQIHGASGDVVVRTGSGDVDVADVTGDVTGRAGSGNLRLAHVTGAATVETGSGDIDAKDLRGSRTAVHTGSGNTTLVLATAQDVDANTGSGDVRLTVPGGQTYRVSATSSSGDLDVRVPSDASGTHHVKVRTGSGNITVQPS
ncbi:DUF4097 family beta strand repeat-containing protein [Planosporangium sp. 12N6]|uniref:DUF4097 family beta strand repeat-containing protein n=1 Tax=Planosporangium spinosum TaxID=3402278 RepID=UPI003CF322D6